MEMIPLAVGSTLGVGSETKSHGCNWAERVKQALFDEEFVIGAGNGTKVVCETQGDPGAS